MPKRSRPDVHADEEDGGEAETNDSKVGKIPARKGRAEDLRDEEEEEFEEEEYTDDGGEISDPEGQQPSQNFVAWLEENSTSLSVGELHFSNIEHTGSPDAPNTYCIVYQLKLKPLEIEEGKDSTSLDLQEEDEEDQEPPMVFEFSGGFPFRVLPAAACVGVPLVPCGSLAETGDDDSTTSKDQPSTEFEFETDIHQSLLEDILDRISKNEYTKVPPNWRLPKPASEKATIDGVTAWWKAGEAKTGWDLSKIPNEDYTTPKVIQPSSSKTNQHHNMLLDLYRDLCAFSPLTPGDSRDTIEERFEWRTCLCTYFAWAVPNEAALEALASLGKPVLEIGAGTGYWAWLLAGRGVDVVAYDARDSHDGHKHRFRHGLVRDGGVEQASSREHEGRALMLCWPDIVGDSASDDADRGTFGVDTLKAYAGDTVVYVGELGPGVVRAAEGWGDPFPPGGSSASAAFQKELRAGFELAERVELPNWPPYNSHLTVWKRK